ncbi:trypsin alpha-like [Drosophila biarmipes]|uniref:trypsin alpha-like n=1 Tax=Drosophila biarmipes TaxID=125945 RepID=UPI0007E71AD6|nr:trypsin alpha-like [Drosophila biarmipes]
MIVKYLTLLLGAALLCEGRVPQLDQRIIGGFPVPIKRVPWQVYLEARKSNCSGDGKYCGGLIYKEDIILTAAHCIENVAAKDISVYFGSEKRGFGELVNVSKAISHEDYKGELYSFANDIAVLILSSPIPLGDNASTIKLADETPEVGEKVLATGWGRTVENDANSAPTTLLGTFVRVQNQDFCRGVYGLSFYFITDSMICANEFGKGACQGDSGGPLVNSKSELIGLASFNLGCDKPDTPDIYTNVVVFKDWILGAANIIV